MVGKKDLLVSLTCDSRLCGRDVPLIYDGFYSYLSSALKLLKALLSNTVLVREKMR
jgi:hypothetical protein